LDGGIKQAGGAFHVDLEKLGDSLRMDDSSGVEQNRAFGILAKSGAIRGVANVAGRVPRRFTLRANVLECIEASAAERGVTRRIGRKVRREAGLIVGQHVLDRFTEPVALAAAEHALRRQTLRIAAEGELRRVGSRRAERTPAGLGPV